MKDTLQPKKSSPSPASQDKKLKKPRKITASYLENAGKFYLEKFPASVSHFRLVMGRKIYKSCQAHPDQTQDQCRALLDEVVDKFVKAGLLDDQALGKGLFYSYNQRGWSKRKIKNTLATKGVSSDIIDALFADADTSDTASDDIAAFRFLRRKRIGAFAPDKQDTHQDKWLGALGRAGFDYETSRRALATPLDEIEDVLASIRL